MLTCPIAAAAVITPVPRIGSICPKCGTIEKSGKLSCCAPDGAWFNNCGNKGDAEHTWVEGLQACKSKLAANRIG